MEKIHDLEGYDDLVERMMSTFTPEERLIGLRREEILAGFGPEERLAGLGPEERLAGLGPEEVLRHYKPEEIVQYLQERAAAEGALPPEVLEALRKLVDKTP